MLDEYLDVTAARDWQESDPADGTVRFALIGLGWWTREQVIPPVAESDFCETNALVSSDPDKAGRLADETDADVAMTYEEFHDGVGVDAYDAVYVCTPNGTHLEYVESAAAHGKPILCEKPMEKNAERARAMVDICDEAAVPLMIAYRMQTEPGVRRAKELLANGAVGDPLHVHGHMSDDLLAFIADPNQWRLTPELSGGATVNDIGIYPLNTTRFLFDTDPTAVYGTTRWEHEAFADQDEHATFQVEFPDITAACTISHNACESSHLRVIGTDGELELSPLFFPWSDVDLRLRRGESAAAVDVPQRDQMGEEFDYFADCLLAGRDPHPDGRHGLVDIEAIDAIFQSAETGQRVQL